MLLLVAVVVLSIKNLQTILDVEQKYAVLLSRFIELAIGGKQDAALDLMRGELFVVTRPLSKAGDVANRIAGGDLNSEIEVDSKDETGRNMLKHLTRTHRAAITVGGRSFRLTANPVFNDKGERLGSSMEWIDATAEVAVEKEVSSIVQSAVAGDLGKRLSLDGKDGFMQQLSEQASGVGQINTAMTQLSQLTQQNASASEELAATAQDMSSQSQHLQNTMSFFTVQGMTASGGATHIAQAGSSRTPARGNAAARAVQARRRVSSGAATADVNEDFVKF